MHFSVPVGMLTHRTEKERVVEDFRSLKERLNLAFLNFKFSAVSKIVYCSALTHPILNDNSISTKILCFEIET